MGSTAVRLSLFGCLSLFLLFWSVPRTADAQAGGQVKATPLGTHAGELCSRDRAILFEDPTGVRILYDPGFTIDELDPRVGAVDVILLSHSHTDHIGGAKAAGGTCAVPGMSAVANPTLAAIAATKNAAVFASVGSAQFVARKIQNIRGSATAACAASGLTNELTVPPSVTCTGQLNPGGSRTVRRVGAASGVRITAVPAFHSNEAVPGFVEAPGTAPGTAAYAGINTGFVLAFTNGLTAYLTGDSGLFGDMDTIIRRYYNPKLVVINMGDIFTIGPDEAAFAVSRLLIPNTVMPSHTNEQSTDGGAIVPGSRLDRFVRQLPNSETRVVVPLSGVAVEFDQNGRCVGCR